MQCRGPPCRIRQERATAGHPAQPTVCMGRFKPQRQAGPSGGVRVDLYQFTLCRPLYPRIAYGQETARRIILNRFDAKSRHIQPAAHELIISAHALISDLSMQPVATTYAA